MDADFRIAILKIVVGNLIKRNSELREMNKKLIDQLRITRDLQSLDRANAYAEKVNNAVEWEQIKKQLSK